MMQKMRLQSTAVILVAMGLLQSMFASGPGWTNPFNNPVSFVENAGQFKSPDGQQVLYAYDDGAFRILFTPNGLVYRYIVQEDADLEPDLNYPEKEHENKHKKLEYDHVSMTWENASPGCKLVANNKSAEYYSYIIAVNGQEKNINYLAGYKKLIYKNVYNGIDVEYTIHPNGGVKYALILQPGADPSVIRMKYSKQISLGAEGIAIPTKFGDIIDHHPLTYYASDSSSVISSGFNLFDVTTVGFSLSKYNKSQKVIIDPWSASPVLNNTKKIWEVETDVNGNVYIYGGDMPVRLLKYNSAGTLQWNLATAIDTANYWIGGMVTHQNTGESYITAGSVGKLWKISTAGTVAWTNNPSGVEYWSLSFNCDMTKLAIGGSSGLFTIRGYMFNINLTNGAHLSTKLIGYGSMGFPPTMQEASSITWSCNNGYYFLTLDTIGAVNDVLTTINFKTATSYKFDYYIPNFGTGTKQPISATRANTVALYTVNGTNVHKRDLLTGAVLATATIPGGTSATGFFGARKLPNNAGIDIDDCGNVYVGSINQLVKYDGNLNQLSTVATTFPIYDVDVNNNGDVAVCGFAAGTGYVRAIAMSACAQVTPVCLTLLPVELSSFSVTCNDESAEITWTTETERNNSYFTLMRSKDGMNFEEVKKIPGSGNSNSKKHYSFTDENPLQGVSYYQLSQTDVDGKVQTHEMANFSSTCRSNSFELNAYPNPFNDQLNIELNYDLPGNTLIELLNSTGEKLKTIFNGNITDKGTHRFNASLGDLNSSLYLVKVTVNGETSIIKVLK